MKKIILLAIASFTLNSVELKNSKTAKNNLVNFLIFLFLSLGVNGNAWGQNQTYNAGTTVYNFTSSGNLTGIPAGTTMTIECYGGGGGGGISATTSPRAGGGGGGAYSNTAYIYSTGGNASIAVGNGGNGGSASGGNGGDGLQSSVTIGGSTIAFASGGKGGKGVTSNTTGAGGAGGATGTGTVRSGGNGGAGVNSNGSRDRGGAGGGAGGTNSNGANGQGGSTPSGGSDTPQGGAGGGGMAGKGGNGASSAGNAVKGGNGSNYGGGGGGSARWNGGTSSNRVGGNGAPGYVRITIVPPVCPTITSQPTQTTICSREGLRAVTLLAQLELLVMSGNTITALLGCLLMVFQEFQVLLQTH